jgi:hypothetical protein
MGVAHAGLLTELYPHHFEKPMSAPRHRALASLRAAATALTKAPLLGEAAALCILLSIGLTRQGHRTKLKHDQPE